MIPGEPRSSQANKQMRIYAGMFAGPRAVDSVFLRLYSPIQMEKNLYFQLSPMFVLESKLRLWTQTHGLFKLRPFWWFSRWYCEGKTRPSSWAEHKIGLIRRWAILLLMLWHFHCDLIVFPFMNKVRLSGTDGKDKRQAWIWPVIPVCTGWSLTRFSVWTGLCIKCIKLVG